MTVTGKWSPCACINLWDFTFYSSVLSPWGEGARECLGGHQSSRPHQPTECCRLTLKQLPPPEVLLPSMWSSSVTNRIREQITFPNAKRNPICSPALLEKKLPQESKGKINVLIWQNLLQWIITLSFNCKHGYYCDRVATQKKVTEEVQSSCHCLTKSIFCKYIHIYSL